MTRAPHAAAPAIFFCGACRKNRQTPRRSFFKRPAPHESAAQGALPLSILNCAVVPRVRRPCFLTRCFKRDSVLCRGFGGRVFDAALSDKGLCSAKAVFCAATKEGGKDKMIFAVRKRGEVLSNSEKRGAKGEIRMRRGASVPLSALACAAAQMNAGASEGERTKNSPPGEKAGKKSAVAKRAEDRRPRRASPAFDGRGEGGQRASEGGHRLFFCAG